MVKIEPEKARQGRRGQHMLVVLLVGLALAVIAWFGLEFYGEKIDASTPVEQSQGSQ
ncbi:MAG: hypothetical protein M9924_10230 [Rhizobiaceae bacterium]|nr:hypothetical protein [Rhizobiaceae bacterium]